MDTPTNELAAALHALKTRKVVRKPYYNEQGFTNYPTVLSAGDAYWPQPFIHDLPAEQYDWRDDIKD